LEDVPAKAGGAEGSRVRAVDSTMALRARIEPVWRWQAVQ
jgi:hypothetical protein